MNRIFQMIFPLNTPPTFSATTSAAQYNDWDKSARLTQISAVSFLTALLYLMFAVLHKSWVPEESKQLIWQVHVLVLVPMLLTFSVIAYSKRYYQFLLIALSVYPIISMSFHAYVASKMPDEGRFLTEGYLGVVWIFIVCGLPFRHALLSASVCTLILLFSGFYFIQPADAYYLHVFWLFCSFSFGFLGALLFDRSRKSLFLSQEILQRMAITDELTGVFNRNKFNQILAEEIPRSERYQNPLGLAVIDIDRFKSINDSFGHDTGDRVLKKVAQTLMNNIREIDTLIRWGGEEFVVVAPQVDEAQFKVLCEKLRGCIENASFDTVNNITVSIGAAQFISGDTPNSLLNRADRALYQAKDGGRNRIVISSESPKS